MSARVRSERGLVPVKRLEDHGFDLVKIKEWRKAEADAGRPSGLDDFYAAHGLCRDCGSYGARMIGWSKPVNEIDAKASEELGLEQLPFYEVCSTCQGTGKAERSKWQLPS
jgi:hypothetical protein